LLQEYVIVACLALADALAGVAYLVAGLWRIAIIYTGGRYLKVNHFAQFTKTKKKHFSQISRFELYTQM
jgi:hypothetical protein